VDDLHRLGGPIVERLSGVTAETDAFRFDASSVPSLPPSASTDRMVLTRAYHDYNGCYRADMLHLSASRPTLRVLGVVVLASLFALPGAATDLSLIHPDSEIRTLRLRTPDLEWRALALAPRWYDYRPRQPHKHPWYGDRVDPDDLPALYLTDHDELGGVTDADWRARNTVVGFGTVPGIARFGQFLLDIGDPAGTGDEYHLEGEAGFRGVAPMSAELSVWLPGSIGWHQERDLD
jgi:hypothetical protein